MEMEEDEEEKEKEEKKWEMLIFCNRIIQKENMLFVYSHNGF